ncbi:MAG: recombination regulator RecX [Actinomycetales bacterium]|nr:recombination regulator RecX [Actinomycetales bacterium]
MEEPDADPVAFARLILLRKLAAAPRTKSQLREHLRSRGVPDDISDRLLERFTDLGYIDDEAFAHAWVHARHQAKGLGRRAVRRELQSRGVEDTLVEEALSAITDASERERARAFAVQRVRRLRGLDASVVHRRVTAALMRRGYDSGLASAIAREVIGQG